MLKRSKRIQTRLRHWLAVSAIFSGLFPSPSHSAAPSLPEIYFYPPAYKVADGSLVASPLALGADQLTTLFPVVEEMQGVVMMLPWSLIEPSEGQYDFSLIDTVLNYWKSRGKNVVLGISTSGPPFKVIRDGKAQFQSETPAWIAGKTSVYQDEDQTIGHIPGQTKVRDTVPSYWDPKFAPIYINLIQALGRRYDGNATLSYIRIGTGRVGEDAPAPYGAHLNKAPNFDPAKWIVYSKQIADAYRQAFPHHQLEFDLDLMPWIYMAGDTAVRQNVDQFMMNLVHDNVFVTFDGWQPDALQWHQDAEKMKIAPNRIMHYLDQCRQHGQSIGLEVVVPMFVPRMKDIGKMAALAKDLRPKRLVFFGSDAAGIAFVRHGASPQTATSQQQMGDARLKSAGELTIQLLQDLKQ